MKKVVILKKINHQKSFQHIEIKTLNQDSKINS